jgi:hypothetical protein
MMGNFQTCGAMQLWAKQKTFYSSEKARIFFDFFCLGIDNCLLKNLDLFICFDHPHQATTETIKIKTTTTNNIKQTTTTNKIRPSTAATTIKTTGAILKTTANNSLASQTTVININIRWFLSLFG